MPGDYSRVTFKRENFYSGVLKQQGRVELDADDNEQLSIQHYRDETEATDIIGQAGVPKKNDGFKIGIGAGGHDLTIAKGRFYLEGLLCESDHDSTYATQPYLPNPPFGSTVSPPPSPPTLQVPTGTYLVYLDAWKRELTALDNDAIREVALGGPDTAARLQNVWQVRLLEVGVTSPPSSPPPPIDCKTPLPEFDQATAASTGKLKAQTVPPAPDDNACLLPPETGYTRLENQLYRVEVHTAGPRNSATFKWSRDNASVQTTISKIAGAVLTVADLGKDQVLNFSAGQWVEIVDEESTLKGEPNSLVQIDSPGPGPNEITLKTTVAALANRKGLKLRRWDQTGVSATSAGLNANLATWIDLEGGIQVSFATGNYHTGDYWLIPARTATGEIEWPADGGGPKAESPVGIKHHYCRLALVQSNGSTLSIIADCRKPFPTLTEICAVDICFDNTICDFGKAKNVQEALDNLCRRDESGQCTFVVHPGDDVQAIFDSISPGGDAEICFQAGRYPLKNGVEVKNKGSLKISGVGFGSRFKVDKGEYVFNFSKCTSVIVRDISAQADAAGAGVNKDLNGTLTFLDCISVNVDSVWLKCGSAPSPAATCITVRNQASSNSARVERCFMQPGHQQSGVLFVNVARAHVEDNVIATKKNVRLNARRGFEDRKHFGNIRSLLIREARFGPTPGKKDNRNVTLTSGNFSIGFVTHSTLKQTWKNVLAANPGTDIKNDRDLLRHVKHLAERMILEPNFRGQFAPFKTLLTTVLAEDTVVGSQGITIGGEGAQDVRILNNTIDGVMEGIQVGHSQENQNLLSTRTITIAGNTLSIVLTSASISTDRHAIFVGNCDSLLIENNRALLTRASTADKFDIDGIRVWGQLGDRALVTRNHLASAVGDQDRSFTIGINMHPLIPISPFRQLWLVDFNVAPSRQQTVLAFNGAVQERNMPAPPPP
jgi:hypothetical protein